MSIIVKGQTIIGPKVPIVTDGLVLHFDSANTRSYPGTGLVTNDMARLGETWQMTSNLAVSPSVNGAYIYPDDSSARYAITANAFALLSPTNTLTYDFWCWLAVPRNLSASNLFNDLAQQNGTPYAWVGANNSHLDIQYLRVTGGWSASSFSNYFVGNSNQWVHVVVIVDYNAPLITAYKNGVMYSTPITPAAIRFPNSVSKKYMGAYQGNAVYNWVGKQAVGKVYNRALSATEVLQNYNALATRFINKNS